MHGSRHDPDLPDADAPGAGDNPLRGDERAIYGTDVRAGDGTGDALPPDGTDARGWFMVGLVLFVLFIALLVWAVLQPLG